MKKVKFSQYLTSSPAGEGAPVELDIITNDMKGVVYAEGRLIIIIIPPSPPTKLWLVSGLETNFFTNSQTFASGFNLNLQFAVSKSQLVFHF